MQNYSPVLNPGVGQQQNPGAAVSFDSILYYIGNGHDSKIWVVNRSLASGSLDPNENPNQEHSYWKQQVLDDQSSFNQPINYSAATNRQPAAATAGGNLYFVWIQDDVTDNQPNNSVWATQLLPGSGPYGWSQPVRLCDTGDNPLDISGSNFAVIGWGDYLFGCFNTSENSTNGPGTQFLVYDTNQWPAVPQNNPSNWSAMNGYWLDFADNPNFPNFPLETGNQISMGWFTTAGNPSTPTAPPIYCVLSFFDSNTGSACILNLMDVLPFDQWSEEGGWPLGPNCQIEQWSSVAAGVNIIRDPAGRMRAYYPDAGTNNIINVRVLPTGQIDSDGYMSSPFGQPTPLYDQSFQASKTPAPAFVLGSPQTSTTAKGKAETVLQAYEFVIFPPYGDDRINLVFSKFGKAVAIADAYQLGFDKLIRESEKKLVVTGLVDSPLPIPAVNIASRQTPYSNQTAGLVSYGTTASTGDSRQTNWSWSAGFITMGKASTGVGAAWNISFQAGTNGASGGSSATQLGIERIAYTNLELVEKELLPEGALFGAAVEYHGNEYIFYDLALNGTTYTPAKNAPQAIAIWIEYTDPASPTFTPYANTTGNIWSYTRTGWNARMQQLGYTGDNYFDDVIALQDSDGNYVNAVALQAQGSANPYLQFAWSTNSAIISSFNAIDTSFTESGWHLDTSAYVGISWGVGANVFGIGEKAVGELLAGGSYSRTTTEKTTEGKSWGLTVTYQPQNPPIQLYPGNVTALSWNLWLMKANSQWTEELINYGSGLPSGLTIDPGSEPWRILFEVIAETVVFQGDNRNLVYRDANGAIVQAWYNPASAYSFGGSWEGEEQGSWGWTNLTQVAAAVDGSSGVLPNAVGAPFWFAWGLSQPGYRPYTQAAVFRSATGDIYLISGVQSLAASPPPDNTAWQWSNLAQTPGFVEAAGDPVGFYWENAPSRPELHIFYRGVDGNLHEFWTIEGKTPDWRINNLTASFPQSQKPASDPCALVWNKDPGGPSEHVFYRANDNKIYELYYESKTFQWGQTNLSQATGDDATPEGKPGAFVWNASLHVGYRGSTGEIHELRRQDNEWQPAADPSWDAHATASSQRAAGGPICGFAWERRAEPQTIHWFYVTVEGAVAELYRFDAAANSWGWNNLSGQASGTRSSGKLPPMAEVLKGNVWYFDPAYGSSLQLYLRSRNGSIFELRYLPDVPNNPEDGYWVWTELTGWVADSNGNPLPAAAT